MGQVSEADAAAGPAPPGRAASPLAWVLAAGAVALAVVIAGAVPPEVPVLHGLPRVVAWASVAVIGGGVAAGGRRAAPMAVATLTLAAAAALADEGGSVDATAIAMGAGCWLCLELAVSSLETRTRRHRPVGAVVQRLGEVALVVLGGSLVSLAALTVGTDAAIEAAVLRTVGVVAAVGLVGLVVWLGSVAVRR